jgi:hypothetical protein
MLPGRRSNELLITEADQADEEQPAVATSATAVGTMRFMVPLREKRHPETT